MSDPMAAIHGLFDTLVHSKDQASIKHGTLVP